MPKEIIFGETISTLEKSLHLRSLQHRALTSNIANIDTPNYKAFEVVVQEEINKDKGSTRGIQLVRTHVDHLELKHGQRSRIKLKTLKPPAYSLRGDGNTVDVDRTMGKLAENTLLYKTAAQLISNKFKGLNNVIKGGK